MSPFHIHWTLLRNTETYEITRRTFDIFVSPSIKCVIKPVLQCEVSTALASHRNLSVPLQAEDAVQRLGHDVSG